MEKTVGKVNILTVFKLIKKQHKAIQETNQKHALIIDQINKVSDELKKRIDGELIDPIPKIAESFKE